MSHPVKRKQVRLYSVRSTPSIRYSGTRQAPMVHSDYAGRSRNNNDTIHTNVPNNPSTCPSLF
ncbi:hypothetical protein BDV18DRAFT_136565 [Aspergillus unguis]